MTKLPYDNPQIIKDLYWENGLTQDEIARHYNVWQSAVRYFMKRNKIPTRPPPYHIKRVKEELKHGS